MKFKDLRLGMSVGVNPCEVVKEEV